MCCAAQAGTRLFLSSHRAPPFLCPARGLGAHVRFVYSPPPGPYTRNQVVPSEYTQTSKVVIWLTYSREAYPDCTQLLAYPKGWRTTSAFRPTLEPNAARCCPASNSSQPFARNQVVPSEYTQSSKVVIGVLIVVKRTPVGPTCLIAILIRSPVLKTRRRNHRKNPSFPEFLHHPGRASW